MIFSGVWAKTTALFAAIIAGLLTFIRFRTNKIEKLEEQALVSDKLDDIRKQEKEIKKEVLQDEKRRIKKKLKIKPTNTRRERIARLRDNNN